MTTDPPATAIRGGWWLVLLGLTLGPVLGWLTSRLVASAWSACEDIAEGPAFGLALVDLPVTVIGLWAAFFGGAYLSRHSSLGPGRVVVSLALTAVAASNRGGAAGS